MTLSDCLSVAIWGLVLILCEFYFLLVKMVSSLSLRNLHVLYLGWTFSPVIIFLPMSKMTLSLYFRNFFFFFLPVIIFGLPVKITSSPSLRNFDAFFTCGYILTGLFPTCTYIVDMFTCEDDIIPVLEELASLSIS